MFFLLILYHSRSTMKGAKTADAEKSEIWVRIMQRGGLVKMDIDPMHFDAASSMIIT